MHQADPIKQLVLSLGADLCGIAPVERFADAPKGFHPSDVYSKCRSVVVYAKKLPSECLYAESCVPYTYVNAMVTQEVDLLGIEIARQLEAQHIRAVPLPSDDPYEHWEPERTCGRAILSMRHAGHLAGLGVLGRNTLLINETYGNMIQIGAVLVDTALRPDPLATYQACPPTCRRCLQACPTGALDGTTVDQQLCRPLSNYRTEKGYVLKKCNRCRQVCPHALKIVQ